MAEAILRNQLGVPSRFNVGDVRYTTRNSLGDNYVLCNGDKVTGVDYEPNPLNKVFYSKKNTYANNYIVLKDYVNDRNILITSNSLNYDTTGNSQSVILFDIKIFDTNDDIVNSFTCTYGYNGKTSGQYTKILDGCWCEGDTVYLICDNSSTHNDLFRLSISSKTIALAGISAITTILNNIDGRSTTDRYKIAPFRGNGHTDGSVIVGIGSNIGILNYKDSSTKSNIAFTIYNGSTVLNTISGAKLCAQSTSNNTFLNMYIKSYAHSNDVTAVYIHSIFKNTSSAYNTNGSILFIRNSDGVLLKYYQGSLTNCYISIRSKSANSFNMSYILNGTVYTSYSNNISTTSVSNTSSTSFSWKTLSLTSILGSSFGGINAICALIKIDTKYYLFIYNRSGQKINFIGEVTNLGGTPAITTVYSTALVIDDKTYTESSTTKRCQDKFMLARDNFSSLPIYFQEDNSNSVYGNGSYVYSFGILTTPEISEDGYNAFMKIK